MVCIYPKFSFIEVYDDSNKIIENSKGNELIFFWENEIPFKFFGEDKIYMSDENLINEFYKQISNN